MALEKEDLKQIKEVVTEAVEGVVEPYFRAIQNDFSTVYQRFDRTDERSERVENLIHNDYKQRIEKLEDQVAQLRNLLAT